MHLRYELKSMTLYALQKCTAEITSAHFFISKVATYEILLNCHVKFRTTKVVDVFDTTKFI